MFVVSAVWATLIASTAVAQVASESRERAPGEHVSTAPSHRPGVGFLIGAGLHTGLALGARAGVGDFGVELTGGYQLLIAAHDDFNGSSFDAGSSAQFGSELYWTPWHPLESSAIGLKAGYRYNTVLEHGFAFAISFLVSLSSHIALEGLAGMQIFPGSGDRLKRELGIPRSSDLGYSSSYQFYEYGFDFIWYP